MKKQSDLQSWLVSQLRRISYRYWERTKAVSKARITRGVYLCNHCGQTCKASQIAVDHITPVISPTTGFTTWDKYIKRLFCDADGFQVLCKPCHKVKTDEENKQRRQHKKEEKK